MDMESGLPPGWEARLGLNGRIYHFSKQSQIVQILPPPEYWKCAHSLPYGWEMAIDYDNKNYYINHITQTVTYEDPRTEDDQSTPSESLPSPDSLFSPQPRECEIFRDSQVGFGFIAGSEKPVVIRSVTPGGPSEGKLIPDDQIVKIGAENVMMADRERVIELVREKSDRLVLTVLQPNRSANSSFLNPAKKTFRTMDRPKVRFADDVIINGQERVEGSSPLIVSPGVLRIELENKQTRSFRFQPETTAGDAVAALCDKLDFKDPNLFSLVLSPPNDAAWEPEKNGKTPRSSTTSDSPPVCSSSPHSILIAPWDCLSKVVNNPSVRHHSCYLRLEFMPKDFHKLARNDPQAFEYLYTQCVNDVVSGDVYKSDLSREELVKLAVIQMQELVLSSLPAPPPDKIQKRSSSLSENPIQRNAFRFSGLNQKLSLKYIEKEYGLRRFLPPSMIEAMQKDNATARTIRKSIQQYLKASYSTSFFNQHPTSPIIPTSPILTAGGNADAAMLQLRLQYLKILSPQHLFGGRFFSASMQALMESDITILVGHNYGISQMINAKTKMVSVLAEFQHVTGFEVAPRQAEASTTTVKIEFAEKKELLLTMEPQAAHNFAFMVAGYCRVYGNIDMVLTLPMAESTSAPIYFGPHKVKPSYWNYPSPTEIAPSPSYFYCDFSEPITPAVLSHDTPPLGTPKKNGYHRPPTPPPVLQYPLDENGEEIEAESPVFENLKHEENSDNNNNSSLCINAHEVTYEEIVTSLPESPVSSLSAGQYSDASPSNSSFYGQDEMPTSNGYLVPTPPSQRPPAARVKAGNIVRDDSEGESDWMDLMKALGTENRENGEVDLDNLDQGHFDQRGGDSEDEKISDDLPPPSSPPPPPPSTKNATEKQIVQEIIVPPPPNYPPPKRKESMRREGDSAAGNLQKTKSAEVEDVPKPNPFSSFKPREGEIKVFSLTRGGLESPTNDRPVNTTFSKSENCLDEVQDPATRKKLQETEDLIQYFRRRREEVVGASNTTDGSGQGSSNFDLSGEFNTPIVVSDIAAGNKRLRKAEKAASKNRKSWAGSETLTRKLSMEDTGPISMSNPDLSSSTFQKKRNRSLFRRLFGDRKRRAHSMYEPSGTSSAYGRRKRRFRMPKFRFRRTFAFGSSKKDSRKTVLPTSVSESPPKKSSHFRFPFSGKKNKHHGILVISEPCDGVRGVDLLPSGMYTVAGTMFAEGQNVESEVIKLDSKRPSSESLLAQDDENAKSDVKSPPDVENVQETEVKLRATSARDNDRPLSFSTFQQAVLEGYASSSSSRLDTVDEGRRNSLSGADQSSPCELSLTESSEALQEITRAREEARKNQASLQEDLSAEGKVEKHNVKRKLIPAAYPVVPRETSQKSASLPTGVRFQTSGPQATSTPIQQPSKSIKKRPSHKRPAPPPPVIKSPTNEVQKTANEIMPLQSDKGNTADSLGAAGVEIEEKSKEEEVKSDWEDDPLFKRKSVESPSLMTEIFSLLESNKASVKESKPEIAEEAESNSPEHALPYGENYIMPGVKSTDVAQEVEKAGHENEYENTQKVMYEMFYDEMVSDNSRLTLNREDSVSEQDDITDEDADSDDSETDGNKQGSYDVTFSDDITTERADENVVVLKSYEKFEEELCSNGEQTPQQPDLNMSTAEDDSGVTTSRDVSEYDVMQDRDSSPMSSSPEYVNVQNSTATHGAYFTYQNLITPPGYSKSFSGAKRTPFTKKPPIPPKPIFH